MFSKHRILIGVMTFAIVFMLVNVPVLGIEKSIQVVSGNWIYNDDTEEQLEYVAYIPKHVDENTKIFLFLHGNGEVKPEGYNLFERYEFVRSLKAYDYIVIIPLERKKSNFQKDSKKLNNIIDEVCDYSGAVREGHLYLAGVSAGADAITDIAYKMEIEAVIYMAGSLKGKNTNASADEFATLWEGKDVYYFRDNLHEKGGYNYDEAYIEKLKELSSEGRFNFYTYDLNWEHSHCLVDTVLCPDYMLDEKGQVCYGMLDKWFTTKLDHGMNHIDYMLRERYSFVYDWLER